MSSELAQNIIGWMSKTTEIYLLMILEARCPRSRCHPGWFLVSWVTGSWLQAVYSHGIYSVNTQNVSSGIYSSSYKDISPIGSELHLTLITHLKAISPNIVTQKVSFNKQIWKSIIQPIISTCYGANSMIGTNMKWWKRQSLSFLIELLG